MKILMRQPSEWLPPQILMFLFLRQYLMIEWGWVTMWKHVAIVDWAETKKVISHL